MNKQPRIFQAKPAQREQVPLLIGLVGPSGSGKTFSALRLATGIQQVVGGDIIVIDTEAKRSLHYADQFKFRHLEFGAPFGSLDYLDALQYCASERAGVVVVDSMSHEHEGPGGLLEQHEAEIERISKGDHGKRDGANMLAWARPKAARRQLINTMLQMTIPAMIFCFRAKEKVKLVKNEKGKQEPQNQGWMPIAGEEFIYEMTLNALLLPTSNGKPTWNPDERGERQMVKMPRQFDTMTGQLDEAMGRRMAEWARGNVTDAADTLRAAAADGMIALGQAFAALSKPDKARLLDLKNELKAQLEGAPQPQADAA